LSLAERSVVKSGWQIASPIYNFTVQGDWVGFPINPTIIAKAKAFIERTRQEDGLMLRVPRL
jgi:hypothetical protein